MSYAFDIKENALYKRDTFLHLHTFSLQLNILRINNITGYISAPCAVNIGVVLYQDLSLIL